MWPDIKVHTVRVKKVFQFMQEISLTVREIRLVSIEINFVSRETSLY